MASETTKGPRGAAGLAINTYHCICTQVILATTASLETLATRVVDNSYVVALPEPGEEGDYSTTLNTYLDEKPTVIRLEDGFEKRYFEKCSRCDLMVGYHLDRSQFDETKAQKGCRDDVIYFLPGGLVSTKDMSAGKKLVQDIAQFDVKG